MVRFREQIAPINFALFEVDRLGCPYERPRKTYRDPRVFGQSDQLCDRCGSIDFLELFKNGLFPVPGKAVRLQRGIFLGFSDEIYANARCPFCRLVVSIGDKRVFEHDREVEGWFIKTVFGHEVLIRMEECDDPQADARQESAIASSAIYLAVIRSEKPTRNYGFEYQTTWAEDACIGLLNHGELIGRSDFGFRGRLAPSVDLTIVENWLSRCGNHRACHTLSQPLGFAADLKVLDIESLDCLRVVNLPHNMPYLALSYVRGNTTSMEFQDVYKASDLPQFFQDAIFVVKALNHRYIWTDYLCISTTNPEERIRDIERMGTIYRRAYATIINISPENATEGIPGVNLTNRNCWQRSEQVGDLELVTSLPSLELAVKRSAWGNRGWTFQEGLMSIRCIIFGGKQVYYECATDIWCESMVEPPASFPSLIQPILRGPFQDAESESIPLYWSLVYDYTGRGLTNASDSLRAFQGFIEYFSTQRHMYSIWGMPGNGHYLAKSLLWSHIERQNLPIKRRPDFPSWSWAGWQGMANHYDPQLDAACSITLKLELEDCCNSSVKCKEPENHFLRCMANVATVSLSVIGDRIFVEHISYSNFDLDCDMTESMAFHGKELQYMEVQRRGKFTRGLLLLPAFAGSFERIGSGYMEVEVFEAYVPTVKEIRLG